MKYGDVAALITAGTALIVAISHLVADLKGKTNSTPKQ